MYNLVIMENQTQSANAIGENVTINGDIASNSKIIRFLRIFKWFVLFVIFISFLKLLIFNTAPVDWFSFAVTLACFTTSWILIKKNTRANLALVLMLLSLILSFAGFVFMGIIAYVFVRLATFIPETWDIIWSLGGGGH